MKTSEKLEVARFLVSRVRPDLAGLASKLQFKPDYSVISLAVGMSTASYNPQVLDRIGLGKTAELLERKCDESDFRHQDENWWEYVAEKVYEEYSK